MLQKLSARLKLRAAFARIGFARNQSELVGLGGLEDLAPEVEALAARPHRRIEGEVGALGPPDLEADTRVAS